MPSIDILPSLEPLQYGIDAQRWTLPGNYMINVNVDAAMFEDRGSLGAVWLLEGQ